MNTDSSEREQRRPPLPGLSISRASLSLVLATIMIGQAVMMKELGVWGEQERLYQIVIWFAFLYGFYPQARWMYHLILYWVTETFPREVSSR